MPSDQFDSRWNIEPVRGESYEGRQWGWRLYQAGGPFWHLRAGGTGNCWNIREEEPGAEGDSAEIHLCDLAEFIEALAVFRGSNVYREQEERWE